MDQSSVIHPNAINLHKIADTSDEIIRGLKSTDSKTNDQDAWLTYILLQKVDSKTPKQWAEITSKEEFPIFEMSMEFINDKCSSLEICNENVRNTNREKKQLMFKRSQKETFINEHKLNIRNQETNKFAIAKHCWENDHTVGTLPE